MTTTHSRVLRAELLSFEGDTGEDDIPAEGSVRHIRDGALWIEDGRIRALDHFEGLAPALPEGIEVIDHRGKLIMPGFIDSHVHYVQLDIMASYGRQLLDWLNDYAFPEECRFASREHGEALSNGFLDEMLLVGTTAGPGRRLRGARSGHHCAAGKTHSPQPQHGRNAVRADDTGR